ncbi:MFS-type transporter asR1, partial [Aplysia californica]|uniref:MFS-type transporter asR1 n=1 Tax=Aplysia californica TaxID=6500 RepID=A0ABM0KAB4_APLCA
MAPPPRSPTHSVPGSLPSPPWVKGRVLGVFLTYVTVKESFGLTVLTYGLMFGYGIGLAYTAPLGCAMRWFPQRKGLVNGLVVAGFGGGAFIFDQVQTAFINPDNFKPDKEVDGEK